MADDTSNRNKDLDDKLHAVKDKLADDLRAFDKYTTCLEMSLPSISNCVFFWEKKTCVKPAGHISGMNSDTPS